MEIAESRKRIREEYEYVLKKRANIALSILHPLQHIDPTPVERIDRRFFASAA